jgi:hypothetical protein
LTTRSVAETTASMMAEPRKMIRVPPTRHIRKRRPDKNTAPPKSGCRRRRKHSPPVMRMGGRNPTLNVLTSSCLLAKK